MSLVLLIRLILISIDKRPYLSEFLSLLSETDRIYAWNSFVIAFMAMKPLPTYGSMHNPKERCCYRGRYFKRR